ncbi:FMN-binding glutamate synthase family protein [Oceanobacillus longus]|uniref:FMN-binding glutamate synthase family protein n=1 Tax=Oceanobacillus longus TaxID=930120 RepID=A0ABV8GUA2_9BACI
MMFLISIIILGLLSILFFIFFFFLFGWRWLMKRMVKQMGEIIFTDSYQENLMEMIPGFKHMGIQNSLENNLRAETGDVLHRPLGSSKKWPHFDNMTFIPAQLSPFPVDGEEEVDVKVTIGPRANKPLQIEIPLIISGMAYGIALSEEVRLALVGAANQAGTAINSGEGGVMSEEIKAAEKYILQFSKTDWSKDEKLIKQADMIEIKFGQGALAGMGGKISPENLTGRAREVMGLQENEDAVIYEHFFENQTINDLRGLVKELRQLTGGVPIGAKIAAGGKLEEDIDQLIDMGVDFISVDGGQAATHGAPPILADDFGIPTLHAVVRAVNHLEKRKMKGKISLIVSGGLFTPGEFLKILALGADAVYLGTVMLFSVAHSQTFKALPFEPPTQVVWNEGKFKNQFKKDEGVKTAAKFLTACIEEIRMGLRAMGKKSLKELTKKDLVSYDQLTATMADIPFTFEPWQSKKKKGQEEPQKDPGNA